jgi:hypothetical protein
MPSLTLTVRVLEAALREAGDREGRIGDNEVQVALLWPRPGKAEALGTTGRVTLTDHVREADAPDRPALFDALVLKEDVEGEVALLVQVTEGDRAGRMLRFLRRLGAAAIEAGSDAALLGVPGVVRHAFSAAAQDGAVAFGDLPEERVDVVATCDAPLVLSAPKLAEMSRSGEAEVVRVALSAPRDLGRPREKGRLAPGRPNGWLALELRVTAS